MPLIKLKHISSFSSEDTAQPSSNLLKPETYRKWRCAKPGEKQAVVVFELEKATRIHAIDIGNNGSALIEVLVGRSSDSSDQYKVILVTSSFMSPAESKTFTSTSRVRMFGSDKLSKPVAEEKWDKVKIVCSQPFNKNERYGLSFVSLHSPPEDSSNNGKDDNAVPTTKRLGSFTLKDEEEDTLKPGSLFFQNKKTKTSVSSTAAQVRDAAASTSTNSDKSSVAGSFFKNRHSVSTKPNEERKRKPEKQESKPDKLEITEKKQVKPVTKERPVKQGRPVSSANISEANSPPPKKSKKQKTENIPFHQILKSTVFVLSGFKNPERSELRDKALEMGAQYRADWVVGCTHLICAFSNTPKYYQVKGKGKIVTKKWILDSHRKKRKLPTKNYHLPGDTSSSEGSSNEEDTTSNSPDHSKTKVSNAEKSTNNEDIRAKKSNQQEISPYDEDTDEEIVTETKKKENPKETDSEQDTEDELERVQPKDEKEEAEDIYDISTEDEDDDQDQNDDESGSEGLPELPDFFSKKHFLLYGEMDPSLRRTLIRYITAYDGVIEDYMTESVDFVITNETWDENFEEALAENSSLAFIKPKWIYACHEESAMAPFQPYIITPS